MKIKYQNIIDDMTHLQRKQGDFDYSTIDLLFGGEEVDISNIDEDFISSSAGVKYSHEYLEYVAEALFPTTGEWLQVKPNKNDKTTAGYQKAVEIQEYMHEKFIFADFYKEIARLLKQGILYNKGLIKLTWKNGLEFKTIPTNSLIMPRNCEPSKLRCYETGEVSFYDLLDEFENAQAFLPEEVDEYDGGIMVYKGIVPVNIKFFDDIPKSNKAKFKKIAFAVLDGAYKELKSHVMEEYTAFPLLNYSPALTKSLADLAKKDVLKVNQYEILRYKAGRQQLNPAIFGPQRLLNDGLLDFSEGAFIPLESGEGGNSIGPLNTVNSTVITREDITEAVGSIKEIFKIDLIRRAKITGLSSFESAELKLAALDQIAPLVSDLSYKIPSIIINRAFKLLEEKDEDFKKLTKDINITFKVSGFSEQRKRLRRLSGLARSAQASSFYVQLNPSSKININSDKAIREIYNSNGVVQTLNNESDVKKIKKAIATKQKQENQLKQQQMSAEVAATTGKAVSDLGGEES